MSDLLDTVIAAHGGWDRWRQLKTLTVHFSASGIWYLKGWPNVFADAHVVIDPHRQHAEFSPFIEAGRRGVFEPDRIVQIAATGDVIGERLTPRQAFAGHGLATPWDDQHLLYFAGYAMWTYLTTPFLFRLAGFRSREIEPWDENGEIWRRLQVTFPADIASHSTEQTFYFDGAGLLRRHDYSVDILGGTSSANYASEPRDFAGFIFPTRRRVYAVGPDNRPILDRVAVAIDIAGIEVA